MIKRCALLVSSLALLSTTVGCCCLGGYGYRGGGCSPCASPCGPSGCSPSYYPPQGAMGGGIGQQAYLGEPQVMTASPMMPGLTHPVTAYGVNPYPVY